MLGADMTSAFKRGSWWHADMGLSALLVTQAMTLFVAIPLGPGHLFARMLLDACHLAFAVICIAVLTRNRAVQAMLLLSVLALSSGPIAGGTVMGRLGLGQAPGTRSSR